MLNGNVYEWKFRCWLANSLEYTSDTFTMPPSSCEVVHTKWVSVAIAPLHEGTLFSIKAWVWLSMSCVSEWYCANLAFYIILFFIVVPRFY